MRPPLPPLRATLAPLSLTAGLLLACSAGSGGAPAPDGARKGWELDETNTGGSSLFFRVYRQP